MKRSTKFAIYKQKKGTLRTTTWAFYSEQFFVHAWNHVFFYIQGGFFLLQFYEKNMQFIVLKFPTFEKYIE